MSAFRATKHQLLPTLPLVTSNLNHITLVFYVTGLCLLSITHSPEAWTALRNGYRVDVGGWCPKGRKAEDGVIDPNYPLKEAPSSSHLQRTESKVRDSDGTLVFSLAPKLTGGSLRTVEFAREHKLTPPNSSTNALAAKRCFAPNPAIAASFVLMVR
jgi:Circularly permutated YpsA SLOG family